MPKPTTSTNKSTPKINKSNELKDLSKQSNENKKYTDNLYLQRPFSIQREILHF